MRDYGQFCPIARSSELLAERWTPIIVRNLLLALGIHPQAMWQILKLRRRGAILDQMRRTRGLSPLPRGESR